MSGTIHTRIKSGCRKCGNTAIHVSEHYRSDTVIYCSRCGHSETWEKFFSVEEEEQQQGEGSKTKASGRAS
jgi:predicted nucleic-acid-binding Zn-ribbon protein